MKNKLNCVMLIDDDEMSNLMNKTVIREAECTNYIIKRKSAKSGLKYLLDSSRKRSSLPKPDLIFLDIEMPDLNGWDFMDYYQDIQEQLPNKPMIFMLSSFADADAFLKVSDDSRLSGLYRKPLTVQILDEICDIHFICA